MRQFINIVEKAEATLLVKQATLKDGTQATVRVDSSDLEGCVEVELTVDGQHIGSGSFGENDWDGSPGEWSAMSMHVDGAWKRKGVATAMYDAVEEVVGKVVPEPRFHKRSEEANAFWRARDPKNYGRW